MPVHQYHSGLATGDGVTNAALFTQKVLHELGIESELFGSHLEDDVASYASHISKLRLRPEDTLIVRHSMGFNDFEHIKKLHCKKVLWYHNITPPYFFPEGSHLREYSQLGLEQLKDLTKHCDLLVSDSSFNKQNIIDVTGTQKDIFVIPSLVDTEAVLFDDQDFNIRKKIENKLNILSVGRVAENKGIENLLFACQRLLELFPYLEDKICWNIVGAVDINSQHWNHIQGMISRLGMDKYINFTGKAGQKQLSAFYKYSDLFVSLSEHEGFCLPVVEAMCHKTPIIVHRVGALEETLNQGGVVIDRNDYSAFARAAFAILTNREVRSHAQNATQTALHRYERPVIAKQLSKHFAPTRTPAQLRNEKQPYQFIVRGPLDSSYSLAQVNRELALGAGEEDIEVYHRSTEGSGDFAPSEENFKRLGFSYNSASSLRGLADLSVSNMWPPRLSDARSKIRGSYFFWEESLVPEFIISEFNRYADIVFCPTHFVRDALNRSGLIAKTEVVGAALSFNFQNRAQKRNPTLKTADEEVVVFHNSSLFQRKDPIGTVITFVNVLDRLNVPVRLLIKTFKNIHNKEFFELIAQLPKDVREKITVLDQDASQTAVQSLYRKSHVFFTMTRGEGLGLPVLEAAREGLSIVAPQHTGLLDLECENWYPIKSKPQLARTHLSTQGSYWWQCDLESATEALSGAIIDIFENRRAFETRKSTPDSKLISPDSTWNDVFNRMRSATT